MDKSTENDSDTSDIEILVYENDHQHQSLQKMSQEDKLERKRRLIKEHQQKLRPKVKRIEKSNAGATHVVTYNPGNSTNLAVLQAIPIQPTMQTIVLPPQDPTVIYVTSEDLEKILNTNAFTKQQLGNLNSNSTIVLKNEGERQNVAGQASAQNEKSPSVITLDETDTPTDKGLEIFRRAFVEFRDKFTKNTFGHSCKVCERLWFKEDLCLAGPNHAEILVKIVKKFSSRARAYLCGTCRSALDKKKIPAMASYNGFSYPPRPPKLPELDLVSERLVAPIIPFVQIRRLSRAQGKFDIFGQVINIPASGSNMAQLLPRDVDDDHSFYVNIKNNRIYKSTSLQSLIDKEKLKMWLQYLVRTPLYELYNIKVKHQFLENDDEVVEIVLDDVIEEIPAGECLTAQNCSSTLLWNVDNFLKMAPGEPKPPHSLLFEDFAEELYFPSIYLGQIRKFKEEIHVSPFMIAASELKRTDRRGVTPCHLLYLAMKIMRQRVKENLAAVSKFVGANANRLRQQIESEDFMNSCIQSNIAFLRCIPNSDWYWEDRKRDLFAILRQKGKPTAFMTLTANEIEWPDLLQILYKLKNKGATISREAAETLPFIKKCTLVNEDAPTCAIFFNRLITVLLNILQSKKYSPFVKYRLMNYFTRVEFHRGSPRVLILMWLDKAPKDFLGGGYREAMKMMDILSSVSPLEASAHFKLQTHKHSSACYESILPNVERKCRFGAPFMPCKTTLILTPLDPPTDDVPNKSFERFKSHYLKIRENLERFNYEGFEDFFEKNSIHSHHHYVNILRAGIERVTVFLRRMPSEKWIQPFNPFISSVLGSNMDFQFIIDDFSCAEYVLKCVSKINRGVSDLRKKIVETMKEYPEFGVAEVTQKISDDVLNSVEITSQEAAWYLLREPLSKSSIRVAYIPTIPPNERQKARRSQPQSAETEEDATNAGKDNCFVQYEQRSETLEDLTLAEYTSLYYKNLRGFFVRRQEAHVIRYRNYDVDVDIDEYKREMVTLHIPFRNEEKEIIENMRFVYLYDDNEDIILNRRKDFESNFNMLKALDTCEQLYQKNQKPDVKTKAKVYKNNRRKIV